MADPKGPLDVLRDMLTPTPGPATTELGGKKINAKKIPADSTKIATPGTDGVRG